VADRQMGHPIAVEARFGESGRVIPLNFVWRGQVYPITDVGRSWEDEQGRYHFLVMTPPDRVFEIVFASKALQWTLVSSHERPRVV